MSMKSIRRGSGAVLTLALVILVLFSGPVRLSAATAKELDAKVDAALDRFYKEVKGGQSFLQKAQGVLVFSGVVKAGIGIGGEYGEGALRVGGKTVDYYSIASGSIGFQLGAQKKDVIIVFLEAGVLERFQKSSGWKVGVDGSVAIIDIGAGGSIDSMDIKAPIVGFVVGQKGLMFNLSLEGSKIGKVHPK